MKVIKINESQKNRLFEAYQDGFSFKELSMIGNSAFSDEDNSKASYAYCVKWLGEPPFHGSSRAVFTLSDNLVLKLAYGNYFAGIEQNRVEYDLYEKIDSPLLTRILYHDENFTYLVCENALEARSEDFEKLLGLPFWSRYHQNSPQEPNKLVGGDYDIGFGEYFDDLKDYDEYERVYNVYNIVVYMEDAYSQDGGSYDLRMEKMINSNSWLKELRELYIKTNMTDLSQIENFGVVNRDGNPMIVVLDSGFNYDVYLKFYRFYR